MPSSKNAVGLHVGSAVSFLDHLVPLCQLMDIPLVCTDTEIVTLIELYYPSMPVTLAQVEDYCLDNALKGYDTYFYVDHYKLGDGSFQFGDYVARKGARSVCALHGNSDKKRNAFWIERFADEDLCLLYGKHMQDFLDSKGLLNRCRYLLTGNFRLEYYRQHKEFMDHAANRAVFPQNNRQTLLYAPTWTSPNLNTEWRSDYTTFFAAHEHVLTNIPEEFQVLVKLHPHFSTFYPEILEQLRNKYAENEQILFTDIPTIYPLLEQVDIYLGDYSSIGYDFLYYNRPLFFLHEEKSEETLFSCGEVIEKNDYSSLYQKIRHHKQQELEGKRNEAYEYAFGKKKSLLELRHEIEAAL